MKEVVGPLSTLMKGFALSDLVLMVREGQVDSSRVNIQLIPKHVAESSSAMRYLL